MANPYDTLSPEDYAQQQQLNRQQKMAEMLMQNNQQPQGQMVSGRYVAPSFFQNLAPLVNTYVGKGMLEEGDKKQQALAEAIRGKQNQQVQGYLSAMQGTPAVMPEIQRDDMGNVMPPVEKASGPNLAEAFKYATNPYAPAPLQAAGYKMLEPQKLREGEKLFTPSFQNNSFNPTIENKKVNHGPADVQSAAIRLGLNPDPTTWTPQMVKAIDNKVRLDKLEGRSVTNVSVPVSVTTQKAYGQEFGGLIAKQDMDKYTVAQGAPKLLEQSMRIKDLVSKGAFTGTGSEFTLNAAKVLNIAGANNAEKVKNTELLVASLGQNVLNNIKTSGLGAGQGFTDKDRVFLERVVGGQIALDKTTLTELATLQEKAAKASMSSWNERMKTMPKDVVSATGIGPVYMSLNTNPNDVFNAADAIINPQGQK